MSLSKLLGFKKKFTDEDFKNKSLIQLIREAAEDAGYEVTVNFEGVKIPFFSRKEEAKP